MASGINHAKRIVIEEAESLADDLQNGHSGDLETHGRAIGLIVKMITPMYAADFVTSEECKKNRDSTQTGKVTKIKFGPLQFEGQVTTALLRASIPLACCGILLFVMGRQQEWW